MATSSKRFIIIMLLMDIILAMAIGFSAGNSDYNTQITSFSGGLENTSSTADSRFNTINTDQSEQYIKDYGDRIGVFKSISSIFSTKLGVPDELNCPGCPDAKSSGIMIGMLVFFFAIIHLLAIYEVVMIVVNKKQD